MKAKRLTSPSNQTTTWVTWNSQRALVCCSYEGSPLTHHDPDDLQLWEECPEMMAGSFNILFWKSWVEEEEDKKRKRERKRERRRKKRRIEVNPDLGPYLSLHLGVFNAYYCVLLQPRLHSTPAHSWKLLDFPSRLGIWTVSIDYHTYRYGSIRHSPIIVFHSNPSYYLSDN